LNEGRYVPAAANSVPQPSTARAAIRSLSFGKKPKPKHNFKREANAIDPGPSKPAPPEKRLRAVIRGEMRA